MRKIESFTNQYPVQKTLRFKLIPIGETEHNFRAQNLLEKDKILAENYSKVKGYLDRFYRDYIDRVLSEVRLNGLSEYAALYYHSDKTDEQRKEMGRREDDLRKQIAYALKGDKLYKDLFKEPVLKLMLAGMTDEKEIGIVHQFDRFASYFYGFFQNRENMFSEEAKSTGVANRCISDNLPRFLDNAKNASKIFDALSDQMEEIDATYKGLFGVSVKEMFSADYFSFVLSQDGISCYNQTIGGYTNDDGSKVKGLNEYINLYNQQVDRANRIPKFKPLYKQILSEAESVSFIPEKFETDPAVLDAILEFYQGGEDGKSIPNLLHDLNNQMEYLSGADLNRIYVESGTKLTSLCNGVFGRWDAVLSAWNDDYDAKKGYKDTEKYIEARSKAFKAIGSFSISEIERYGTAKRTEESGNLGVCEWLKDKFSSGIQEVETAFANAESLLTVPYSGEKKLPQNEDATALIKTLLDSLKELERTMELLLGTGKEEDKDDAFYGEYLLAYDRLASMDRLYDKVRNYMTQKPFSTDKIKLNFENDQFLSGWDRNKESASCAILLRKNAQYYLAIMGSGNRNLFDKVPTPQSGEPVYEKMVYKQIPNAAKYFSGKQIFPQNPPLSIQNILVKKKEDSNSLSKDEIKEFIDYIKFDFLENYPKLHDENGEKYFHFDLKPSVEYDSLNQFFRDIDRQAYQIRFCKIPDSYIDKQVKCGNLYLFKLHNKDMSENSHGRPNLHTLYFKALFDSKNLEQFVFKLNGGAEMFYREASIKDAERTIHPANMPIQNKNPNNPRRESTFAFDLIKDDRYTHDQFMLHVPITMNFTAPGIGNINESVNRAICSCENNYVIGIDRGERNLIYISVVDENGKIAEQYSLNEIINEYNGNTYTTDYRGLLDKKEEERKDARKNWTAIGNIKDLKEGYISQVVHKICELVEKYDAVIAMEDLNFGFKQSRGAVEKSVYQKFEKMLIDKLNFYADKKKDADAVGGIMHAYQLTNKFVSFERMGKQNGFIFYIPAWMTSKIDPVTGFVDLLYPKYESVEAAKAFFGKFDRIGYSKENDRFEFSFDYGNFKGGSASYRKKWTVCSYGNRVETKRDPKHNNEWTSTELCLTDKFKALFHEFGIGLEADMKERILARTERDFFSRLTGCFKLLLQMRNSKSGTDIDYLISPVANKDGVFYCSNDYHGKDAPLPIDADANGAYNIARKAQMLIARIKATPTEALSKVDLKISNQQWLEETQK